MRKKQFWAAMAALACVMWGISGLFAKSLFNVSKDITPLWLTQIRLIISGLILLLTAGVMRQRPLACLKTDCKTLTAYGLLGLVPVQLFYFVVVQQANASVATVLQFCGPFIVMAYMVARHKQVLRWLDVLAALGAFAGVFLLATHGDVSHLALTPAVLFWGALSAIGVATNTLIPIKILKRVPSLVVTGWGMLFAGIALFLIHPQFASVPNTPRVWIDVLGVIIIGTLIPFQLMMNSLRFILPSTATLLDAFEPWSATIGSVLFFGLVMTPWDIAGSILVVVSTLALNVRFPHKKARKHR